MIRAKAMEDDGDFHHNPAQPEPTGESIPQLNEDEAVINHGWTRMDTDFLTE